MTTNLNLAEEVWSEQALAKLLGVNDISMDNLRYKHGLPAVTLAHGIRVYLARDVLDWLRGLKQEPDGRGG